MNNKNKIKRAIAITQLLLVLLQTISLIGGYSIIVSVISIIVVLLFGLSIAL